MYSQKKNFSDLSLRQKRRIIDQDVRKLCSVYEQTVSNAEVNCESIISTPKAFSMSADQPQNIHLDHQCFSCSKTEVEREIAVDECFDCIYESSDSEMQNETLGTHGEQIVTNSFSDNLCKWVLKFNISHRSVNSLLKLLKHHGHDDLPTDVRTLLKTPRKADSQIVPENGGSSSYFGLKSGLIRSINKYYKDPPDTIKLDINVDGLPIAKSSGSQFWPILCSLVSRDFFSEPFVVKIFHGNKKPDDVNIFLKTFIEEAQGILKEGIILGNKSVQVKINAVICDAPARAFICGVKNHSGYFGCGKCIQEGNYFENRVIFPEINATLRSDTSFKNRSQPEHHVTSSCLENLGIGMVSQVPLDYMHLVCLGVMKRLLTFWVHGRMDVRIKKTYLTLVNDRCLSVKRDVTKEFSRSARSILEVDRWKATEFRQFILYTGMFVLRNILPQKYYVHFLSLSVAIRIMADKEYHMSTLNYANQLLIYFVEKYGSLYGNEYQSYNVHNLIHLHNDVKKFGPLDTFSAFKYENFMFKLKLKLKSSSRPLHQIVNRIIEQNRMPVNFENKSTFPFINYKNDDIDNIQFETFCLTQNKPNNCCLIGNNIVLVEFIFIKNNILYIRGRQYMASMPFFSIPCDSREFNIVVVSQVDLSSTVFEYKACDINRKFFVMDMEDENFLLVPLVL